MKIKNKVLMMIFLIITILAIGNKAEAALISKPGEAPYYMDANKGVTTAYGLCRELRLSDSTLGNNSLDPHLMLPKEWLAVDMLANSVYGFDSQSNQLSYTDTSVNIKYQSSTPNKSGIMYEYRDIYYSVNDYTSSIYSEYDKTNDSCFSTKANIFNNKGTKYVQTIEFPFANVTYTSSNNAEALQNNPILSTRGYSYNSIGSFGVDSGRSSWMGVRPVIWNMPSN